MHLALSKLTPTTRAALVERGSTYPDGINRATCACLVGDALGVKPTGVNEKPERREAS